MFALQDSLRDRLHRRRHPRRFALLDELLRNQALSREALQHKQRDDLAHIIAFAAADTDYYAQRYAGIHRNATGTVPPSPSFLFCGRRT